MATIEKRTRNSGTVYRVKIRKKGYPPVQATFNRKSDAKKWASQTEAEIDEGRYFNKVEARKHTFAELADRFLTGLPVDGKSTKKYTQQIGYWKEQIGKLLLIDVTPDCIGEVRDKLSRTDSAWGKTMAPATVNRYLAALSICFSKAEREYQWVESNPVKKVKRLPEPKGRTRFLSEDAVDDNGNVIEGELTRLLRACKESDREELYPVVTLLLATGARRDEIIGLLWREVDLKRGIITFTRTKSGKSRSVPVSGEALEILRERNRLRRIDTNLVFSTKQPRKSSIRKATGKIDLRKAWVEALEKAGIKDFRIHDLRHTTASYLVMSGVDLRVVGEILGHSNITVTQRYTHLNTEHLRGAMNTLSDKLSGGKA